MAKKIILALVILILIIFFGILFLGNDSVDIYIDGENITVETTTFADIDKKGLNQEICDYTFEIMNDTTTDMAGYRNGVEDICGYYGLEDVEINIDHSGHRYCRRNLHASNTAGRSNSTFKQDP